MAQEKDPRPASRLARARIARQVSQSELAEATGLSLRTVQRIEHVETDNPPLRYLVNLALALGVELDDLIEDEWRTWRVFDVAAGEPPGEGWPQAPSARWNQSKFSEMRRRGQSR